MVKQIEIFDPKDPIIKDIIETSKIDRIVKQPIKMKNIMNFKIIYRQGNREDSYTVGNYVIFKNNVEYLILNVTYQIKKDRTKIKLIKKDNPINTSFYQMEQ